MDPLDGWEEITEEDLPFDFRDKLSIGVDDSPTTTPHLKGPTYQMLRKIKFNDPYVLECLKEQFPVVMTGSNLLGPVLNWNLEYLEKHITGDSKWKVQISKSRNFMYYDEEKNLGKYDYTPPYETTHMTFQEFTKKFRESEALPPDQKTHYMYLQQTLTSDVPKAIIKDASQFNWAWIFGLQKLCGWQELKQNNFWLGEAHVTTQLHYDEAENFFAEISGRKRFRLFPPGQFKNLYTNPLYHAFDRQSQINLDSPDYEKFPNLASAKGYECLLEPGDVLYLPAYWFHHVYSLERTLGINFWFVSAPAKVKFPLNDNQIAAVRRNIEKLIGQAVGPENVGDFLKQLTNGRFDYVNFKK